MTATAKAATIANLPENASKQAEIDHLNAFYHSLPPNSYLASLINQELCAWVTSQIRNDLPPDIMDTVHNLRDREVSQLAAITDMEQTIKNLHGMIDAVQQERQRDVAALNGRLEEARARYAEALAEIDRQREIALDTDRRLCEAQERVALLKVALFNLQNPDLA